ncbi:3-deoxy-7-phosphoheptulonate synthase class II [bacterium]|nr:3-deoxy-7-phosphoheptulonate synthase class II [bacterium]
MNVSIDMTSNNKKWSPESWRTLPAKQQPEFQDKEKLNEVLSTLKSYPPLVFAGEVEALKAQFEDCSKGERFILQGGDCAERFLDCNENTITAKLKILLQMSVVLCYGARKPIVRIGRIAGQYGKPRSANTEVVDGVEIPVYRGDNVNSFEANLEARKPNPDRLLKGYHLSSMTLNYVRALTKGGFADLHHPENWDLRFVGSSKQKEAYEQVVQNIQNAISFMESLGTQDRSLDTVEFYTSHEGLILGFEESMTRYVPEHDAYYNLGAHMLWIGDRTRQIDGAHIEYFRGIANPIGIKVGPTSTPEDICQLVKALNPSNKPGKIVLITRFGHDLVEKRLGSYIEAVSSNNLNVVWSADPMHGNGNKTDSGIKTRNFDHILSEVEQTFRVHSEHNSHLGGVHFELTGENVTECLGGSEGLTEKDLSLNYATYCDPRLNYSQSLEMAFLLSTLLKK